MSFEPFGVKRGRLASMPAANIDTDVIMPKQFLKGIGRDGLAQGVFFGLRFAPDGSPQRDFILNRPGWTDARFLVVGPNFGCGSSREHAVWGLRQLGIDAIIGTTFGGIFFDNCARNGLLPIQLSADEVAALAGLASDPGRNMISVDLGSQRVTGDGLDIAFAIGATRKESLSLGLDAVGSTLRWREDIERFESDHLAQAPWLA